jgi:single-stranded DNA-binding protein
MKAEFSFEVDRPFYRVSGEPVSDLFLVDVWGDLGKWAVENVKSGSHLVVVGTLNKESYLTRGGREHLTVIKAKAVRMLDGDALEGRLDVEAIKEDVWSKDTLSKQMETIRTIVDT